MATIQLEKPKREWNFGCWSRGGIWTKHNLRADSHNQVIELHDRRYPEHQFVSAVEIPHRRKRSA